MKGEGVPVISSVGRQGYYNRAMARKMHYKDKLILYSSLRMGLSEGVENG